MCVSDQSGTSYFHNCLIFLLLSQCLPDQSGRSGTSFLPFPQTILFVFRNSQIFMKIHAKMRAHELKTRALAMHYKNSDMSQQKSRKCGFLPFLNRHQKKIFYSLLLNRQKCYESSKTEYSDSTSFINRLTPLIFFQDFKIFSRG